MLPINQALVQYILDPDTEFAKKYFGLARRSHSPEAMTAFRDVVAEFFTSRLDEKRALLAMSIIQYILRENDMVGMANVFRFLTLKELGGEFYRKYRDHTCHAVLMFFLGCYLFERVPSFRELYETQHVAESGVDEDPLKTGFFYQWSCVSLFHDFGYFFDVDEPILSAADVSRADIETSQAKREKVRLFFAFLEKYFNEYLLRQYREWKGIPDLETQTAIDKFQNFAFPAVSLPYNSHLDVRFISDLRVAGPYVSDQPVDGFDLLDEFCGAHYSQYSGVLRDYFKALNERGAPYAEPYVRVWDHGIASALLFLKLCAFGFQVTDILHAMSSGLRKHADPHVREVAAVFDEQTALWDYRPVVFRKTVTASALAMAIHNLRAVESAPAYRADRYEPSDIRAFTAVQARCFPVRPESHFLGFLVLVVDQLQDWDRYRIVRSGDESALRLLEGYQLDVDVERGKFVAEFRGAGWVQKRGRDLEADINRFTQDREGRIIIRTVASW
jgi:hypothetical protein